MSYTISNSADKARTMNKLMAPDEICDVFVNVMLGNTVLVQSIQSLYRKGNSVFEQSSTKIQSLYRKHKSNNDAYIKLNKNKQKLSQEFKDHIEGYHLINDTPIKCHVWEEFNNSIVDEFTPVSDSANGNHLSGRDAFWKGKGISQKSIKIDNNTTNSFSLSSYRLTKVCSNKNVGDPNIILKEINKRDESFDYYSILLRKEFDNKIKYYWAFIPKKSCVFNINKTIIHKLGKRGNKKGSITGWESKHTDTESYFDITFSMSSHLWFKNISLTKIKKYILCEYTYTKTGTKVSYADIYKLYLQTTL